MKRLNLIMVLTDFFSYTDITYHLGEPIEKQPIETFDQIKYLTHGGTYRR